MCARGYSKLVHRTPPSNWPRSVVPQKKADLPTAIERAVIHREHSPGLTVCLHVPRPKNHIVIARGSPRRTRDATRATDRARGGHARMQHAHVREHRGARTRARSYQATTAP